MEAENLIKIYDERKSFFQYDLDRKVYRDSFRIEVI